MRTGSGLHILAAFDDDLADLRKLVSEMGLRLKAMSRLLRQAIESRNLDKAALARDEDQTVDATCRQIEQQTVLFILKHQPVASDLRLVIACIRIASDLERIGDLISNSANYLFDMEKTIKSRSLIQSLLRMIDYADGQVEKALRSFHSDNEDDALGVWLADNALDDMYNSLFRELLTYMIEKPNLISDLTHLMFIAKNVERIGDHATNIAELVRYVPTGKHFAQERPKSDNENTRQSLRQHKRRKP